MIKNWLRLCSQIVAWREYWMLESIIPIEQQMANTIGLLSLFAVDCYLTANKYWKKSNPLTSNSINYAVAIPYKVEAESSRNGEPEQPCHKAIIGFPHAGNLGNGRYKDQATETPIVQSLPYFIATNCTRTITLAKAFFTILDPLFKNSWIYCLSFTSKPRFALVYLSK